MRDGNDQDCAVVTADRRLLQSDHPVTGSFPHSAVSPAWHARTRACTAAQPFTRRRDPRSRSERRHCWCALPELCQGRGSSWAGDRPRTRL